MKSSQESAIHKEAQHLQAIFDAIPSPTFIVDADVRIQDFNLAANQLLWPQPQAALYRRGGEVWHCIHAQMFGCGWSRPCQECVIRNSVTAAIAGAETCEKPHRAELRTATGTRRVNLLVTASRLPDTEPPQVMLILEGLPRTLTKPQPAPMLWHQTEIRPSDIRP